MASEGQFVFGMYRRHMKTIGYLGQIDKLHRVAGGSFFHSHAGVLFLVFVHLSIFLKFSRS